MESQAGIRKKRDLECREVPALAQLPPAAEGDCRAGRMRRIQDDERVQRTQPAGRKKPGQQAAPVVADQHRRFCRRGIDDRRDVLEEPVDCVRGGASGTTGAPVAALVRCPSAVAQRGQHGQLSVPAGCVRRKPVQAQGKPITDAALERLERQSVGRDLPLHQLHYRAPILAGRVAARPGGRSESPVG